MPVSSKEDVQIQDSEDTTTTTIAGRSASALAAEMTALSGPSSSAAAAPIFSAATTQDNHDRGGAFNPYARTLCEECGWRGGHALDCVELTKPSGPLLTHEELMALAREADEAEAREEANRSSREKAEREETEARQRRARLQAAARKRVSPDDMAKVPEGETVTGIHLGNSCVATSTNCNNSNCEEKEYDTTAFAKAVQEGHFCAVPKAAGLRLRLRRLTRDKSPCPDAGELMTALENGAASDWWAQAGPCSVVNQDGAYTLADHKAVLGFIASIRALKESHVETTTAMGGSGGDRTNNGNSSTSTTSSTTSTSTSATAAGTATGDIEDTFTVVDSDGRKDSNSSSSSSSSSRSFMPTDATCLIEVIDPRSLQRYLDEEHPVLPVGGIRAPRVVLSGLKAAALNGKAGYRGRWVADKDRYIVYLDDNEREVLVKRENIIIQETH